MTPQEKFDALKKYEDLAYILITKDDVKERGEAISKLTKLFCSLINTEEAA